jgi:hypothetical protein
MLSKEVREECKRKVQVWREEGKSWGECRKELLKIGISVTDQAISNWMQPKKSNTATNKPAKSTEKKKSHKKDASDADTVDGLIKQIHADIDELKEQYIEVLRGIRRALIESRAQLLDVRKNKGRGPDD